MPLVNVVVPCEERFVLRNGRPASRYVTYERMWKRYLGVFDSVTVVGRVFDEEDPKAEPVEGPGVRVAVVPGYTGPLQYLRRYRNVRRAILNACDPDSAYILRVPGTIGGVVWQQMVRTGHPFADEIVGDPYDVFSRGGVTHPLRVLFRYWVPYQLRRQCRDAIGAAYVTDYTLQRHYPCPGYSTNISSLTMSDDAIAQCPKRPRTTDDSVRLVMIGHVNQLYKAPHVMLDAVADCLARGLDVRFSLVGEGNYLPWLKEKAIELDIADRVDFKGGIPAGGPVREVLDDADLFVLPSFQEGLPRAMIEAMARALPCIGSSVGGIPELIPEEDRFPAGDAKALANKIYEVARDKKRLWSMSQRNLKRAADFRGSVLHERRMKFYRYVREQTEFWLRNLKGKKSGYPQAADLPQEVDDSVVAR